MKFEIRLLDAGDLDQAVQLFARATKVMRTEHKRDDAIFTKVFLDGRHKYTGAFDDEGLAAFVTCTEWQTVPCASIGNMNIRRGVLSRYNFAVDDNPIIPIMDSILADLESKQIFTWIYNRSLTPAYHRLQLNGDDLLKRCAMGWDPSKQQYRYERFIDEIVEPGQVSKFDTHANMSGRILHDHQYMVVKACLKMEYRPYPNYFSEDVISRCLKNTP